MRFEKFTDAELREMMVGASDTLKAEINDELVKRAELDGKIKEKFKGFSDEDLKIFMSGYESETFGKLTDEVYAERDRRSKRS